MADYLRVAGRRRRVAGGAGDAPRQAERRHARCVEQGFYQDRLSELEQDEQQGVVAERPELVKELQQNLLNDIPVEQAAQAKPINRWALVPGVLLLLAVTVGFI